jgi:hypothetical protein
MWTTSFAERQCHQIHLEGIRHGPDRSAVRSFALHEDARRFSSGRRFEKFQTALAQSLFVVVDKCSPREVIEVAVLARHDETGWYDGRRFAGLGAVGMNVPNLVRAIGCL